MHTIPPKVLERLDKINRFVELIRYDELVQKFSIDFNPSEYKKIQRRRVKEFNFLVEKLYEEITLFLIQFL